MRTIQIDQTRISIKSEWEEFTVQEFITYTTLEKKAHKTEKSALAIINRPESEEDANWQIELAELNLSLVVVRLEQLTLLCKEQKAYSVLETLNGENLLELFYKHAKCLGPFQHWFDDLKAVNSFKGPDFKRHGITRKKETIYQIFAMDNQSLIRDFYAMSLALRIDQQGKRLFEGEWEILPEFLAYVARPAKELKEFSTYTKKRFVGGKKYESLSNQDRLEFYSALLKKTARRRKPLFKDLNLGTALGAFKQYFFFDRSQPDDTPPFIRDYPLPHPLD